MLAAAGPPPDPHHHLLISTRPPGRSSSIVTQLMETPQISPMTAAWSPLTPSPCSTITYTHNRLPEGPKSVPSSVFFSCVRGVCSVSVVLVGPSPWSLCSDLCGAAVVLAGTTTIIPGATSTQYCTVLHCTVLYCSGLLAARIIHLFTRSGD